MSDILTRICHDKRDHITRCKAERSLAAVEADAQQQSAPLGFASALSCAADGAFGLIAEIKKTSPSAGEIRPDFDPATIAEAYQAAGAACLSVLTDKPYFQGDDAYVLQARNASGLPCLRKDFMVDTYQVVEARAIGADCILVIMAAVDDGLAEELCSAADDHSMDVLVEVHNREELDRALLLDAKLIGINNRNLKTLDVDLATTEALSPIIPADREIVCESGLKTHADLKRMEAVGARRFLVGEQLMRQDDIEHATRMLLGTAKQGQDVA
ncbi:MAG: indole-3-glycerol-phosphate synthase [Rhodospirillaceae bacterium]|nr:indole-3-glycerol-phosphate synthase [Rhodospirillaceae bacterium]|tara:strand:- start:661 stop:1473 length:813 start_codon:yes stop_codon:yes gene_type:complete